MQTSEQINELAAALSKAQGKITGALKDSENPFFKSKYADLASCWDAAREQLAANGLAVIQTTSVGDNGAAVVTTMLAHSSGQWVRDTIALMPVKGDPQGMGSCYTYARRYSLAAIVGIAQVDDDGNAASGKTGVHTPHSDSAPVNGDPRILQYAARFRDAMDADENEPVIARMVFEVHDELIKLTDEHKHELYEAVGKELPTKYRNAIKTYITQHKRSMA